MTDLYYLKIREVPSRYYGNPRTFEAQIWRRRFDGVAVWSIVGRSSRHASRDAAERAGIKLAARRKLNVERDPKKIRQVEFRDRYGDD